MSITARTDGPVSPHAPYGPYVAKVAQHLGDSFASMALVVMLRNLLDARELLGYELAHARGLCDETVLREKMRDLCPPPREEAARQMGLTDESLDGTRGFWTMVALAVLRDELTAERLAVMLGCSFDEATALLAPYAFPPEARDAP